MTMRRRVRAARSGAAFEPGAAHDRVQVHTAIPRCYPPPSLNRSIALSDSAPARKLSAHTELLHQSARFIVTVMLPVSVAFVTGPRPWLVYAVLGAIVAFLGDEGGRPLTRLGYMLIGPAALVIGASLGGIVGTDTAFVAVTVLLGLYYGLVEGGPPHPLLIARFGGYGLVLGFTVARITPVDALAAGAAMLSAWLVSLAWDAARGATRPLAVEPVWQSLAHAIGTWRTRWSFALSAGLSIGAANLVGLWIGLGHSYWATLTILVVLRADMIDSADAISHRVSGTLLGVGRRGADHLGTWDRDTVRGHGHHRRTAPAGNACPPHLGNRVHHRLRVAGGRSARGLPR